ncbi:MAG TPA: hypothetical protein VK889_04290 [Solirubrobacterales bacterium]|nr:hypothetical protein [Solirubrobacterales bacterium]
MLSHSRVGFPIRRLLLVAVGAVLAFSASATAAQAACSYPDAEQVFAAWKDEGYYQLAPDGGLEQGGTGWSLAGGAAVVAGNEDHFLSSPDDAFSLSIPFGGSATSPPVCVDETTPSFRLMALNSGSTSSKLEVTVTYLLPEGVSTKDVDVKADDDWEPTKPLELETDGEAERAATISFAPRDDKGTWQVDDLYIDPFARR